MIIRALIFDCFGTVFDMQSVPREEIAAYVQHVKSSDFSPYKFPFSWMSLKAHPDSAKGIHDLQKQGVLCIALSNGSVDLIKTISDFNGIDWNLIVDLVKHRVYKPHIDAYRTVEKETGIPPYECMMVTANPTFGDIEGATAIGMMHRVIRHGYPNTIIELCELLDDILEFQQSQEKA